MTLNRYSVEAVLAVANPNQGNVAEREDAAASHRVDYEQDRQHFDNCREREGVTQAEGRALAKEQRAARKQEAKTRVPAEERKAAGAARNAAAAEQAAKLAAAQEEVRVARSLMQTTGGRLNLAAFAAVNHQNAPATFALDRRAYENSPAFCVGLAQSLDMWRFMRSNGASAAAKVVLRNLEYADLRKVRDMFQFHNMYKIKNVELTEDGAGGGGGGGAGPPAAAAAAGGAVNPFVVAARWFISGLSGVEPQQRTNGRTALPGAAGWLLERPGFFNSGLVVAGAMARLADLASPAYVVRVELCDPELSGEWSHKEALLRVGYRELDALAIVEGHAGKDLFFCSITNPVVCHQGELHEGVATTRNAAVDIAATRLLMAVVGKAAVKAAGIQDPLEAASRQYAAAGLSGSSRLYSTD